MLRHINIISIFFFLGLLAILSINNALAIGPFTLSSKKLALIQSIASPLPDTVAMFRWQSKTSGNKLLQEQTFSDKLYSYFMSMKVDSDHFAAGRGVYASENPHSSSRFVRGDDEGSLIEVQIEKGTPFIDLTDPATLVKLKAAGITQEDVLWGDPPVAVKYEKNEKWWVLKGQKGVSFSVFDGSGLKPAYMLNIYEKIVGPKPKNIYARNVRDYLVKAVADNFDLLQKPSAVEILGSRGIQTLLGRIERSGDEDKIRSLLKVVRSNPTILALINQSSDLQKQIQALESRYSKISEVIEQYGVANADRINDFLKKRFSSLTQEKDYLRHIKALQEAVKGNLELRLTVDTQGLQPNPNLPLSAIGKKQVQDALSRITLGEDEAKSLLKSATPSSTGERLTVLKQLEDYGTRNGFSQTFLSEVHSQFSESLKSSNLLSQITSLPIEQRISKFVAILPYLRKPADLLQLLKYNTANSSSAADRMVAKFIARNTTAILDMKPSTAQLKELSSIAKGDDESRSEFIEKAVAQAKSLEGVEALLGYDRSSTSSVFNQLVAQAMARQTDAIIATNPNIQQLREISESAKGDDASRAQFIEKAIRLVKSADKVEALLSYNRSNTSSVFNQLVAKVAQKNLDWIAQKNLTSSQRKTLEIVMQPDDAAKKAFAAKFSSPPGNVVANTPSARQPAAQAPPQKSAAACFLDDLKKSFFR
jgi:hypothetical protein